MSKTHWLTLKIRVGNSPKITHNEQMILKVCFDEHAAVGDQKQYRYDAEYSGLEPLLKEGEQRFDFEITEAEYNASYFQVHIWGEPYGYVAFRKTGIAQNLALGRLRLEPKNCQKGTVIDRPPNARDNDLQILCELEAVQSVVNYMTDELNTNQSSSYANDIKKQLDNARELYRKGNVGEGPQTIDPRRGGIFQPEKSLPLTNQADYAARIAVDDFACLVHSNSDRLASMAQDLYFCGRITPKGGVWDHKPKIIQIWGTDNRLGNRKIVYFYDIWSNIHYGYIGKKIGFTDYILLKGADGAQQFDNKDSSKDDPVDQQAIREGIQLANKSTVHIADLIQIVEKHPDWDAFLRKNKETD
ncbi:polymorphic toxin type 44 domain-containing protein [Bartonella sp. LJL80]